MKVSIVTTEFGASGGVASVVRFVLDVIRDTTDWNVEVVSLRMSHKAGESARILSPRSWLRPHISKTDIGGIVVYTVGASIPEFEPRRYAPRRWLTELLESCDVILVVSGTPAVAVAVSKCQKPIVLQVATMAKYERVASLGGRGLSARYRRVMMNLVDRLDNRGLRAADSVLVENDLMYTTCKETGIEDFELAPPGVDTDRFEPTGSKSVRLPYLLMVGRLADPRKNVGALISAYAVARESHGLTHQLVLAGMTAPSQQNLDLIDHLDLSNHIEILSPVSDGELVELYQNADLSVSASKEEGLGLTFVESMACGTPVVTTDTAGASFVLGGDKPVGEIVQLDEAFETSFAEAISRWSSDSKLLSEAGGNARERALRIFSSKTTGRIFVERLRASAAEFRSLNHT